VGKATAPALLIAAATFLVGATVAAQCETDVDCKGDRICENGTCVEAPTGVIPGATPPPAPQPAPQPAPAPAPQPAVPPAAAPPPVDTTGWFDKGYGEISVPFVFHGWGGWFTSLDSVEVGGDTRDFDDNDSDGDLEAKFRGGLRLSGYFAASKNFQIGAYYMFFKGEGDAAMPEADSNPDDWDELDDLMVHLGEQGSGGGYDERVQLDLVSNSLGATIKAGTQLGRVWLGLGLDVGVLFHKFEVTDQNFETEAMIGVLVYPRLAIDIMVLNTGSFKMAITTSLGAMGTYAKGKPFDRAEEGEDGIMYHLRDAEEKYYLVSPVMTVGLALGS
jgi:hypothetical protein